MAEYVWELYRLIPRPEAVDGDAVCYLDLGLRHLSIVILGNCVSLNLFFSCVLPRT